MFDGIAPTYDTLNRVLSLGHRPVAGASGRSRRSARHARAARARCLRGHARSGVARAASAGAEVVATDFAHAMLRAGRGKVRRAGGARRCARACRSPTARFDGVVCGFGAAQPRRHRAPACAEMRRVLTPGRPPRRARLLPPAARGHARGAGALQPARAAARRRHRLRRSPAPIATSPTRSSASPRAPTSSALCREVGFASAREPKI